MAILVCAAGKLTAVELIRVIDAVLGAIALPALFDALAIGALELTTLALACSLSWISPNSLIHCQ